MATNIPFDYETDSTRLKRRQQFLEASLPSVLKAPQGQMIGNRYVGEGIAGALSRVLGAYFMGQEQRDIDADAAALKDRNDAEGKRDEDPRTESGQEEISDGDARHDAECDHRDGRRNDDA